MELSGTGMHAADTGNGRCSSGTMDEPVIELRHVSAYRGRTPVFSDLNLRIERGEHTVILGPNGSGKSTLMKLLSREIHPVASPESMIAVFGRQQWNVWELRSRLGMVSHDLQEEYIRSARGIDVVLSGFYSSIDTWGNQTFGERELCRAGEVMRDLGIEALSGRRFGTLSTGQQRRFLLGRTLVNDPEALLLDEPTTGLDLSASFHYLEIMRSLMRNGKTVILVTHHLHEIPPEIDRVVLLREGRIHAEGRKPDLLTSQRISDLFGCPVGIVESNGFYQTVVGRNEK